jgi:hypothetical protein
MTTQNYLMVQENIVTNLCVWDGDVNSWQPPSDATMLIAETTSTKVWGYSSDAKDYVLVDSMGDASIGFAYDGTYCITNEPKPEKPTPAADQPETTGTVTL